MAAVTPMHVVGIAASGLKATTSGFASGAAPASGWPRLGLARAAPARLPSSQLVGQALSSTAAAVFAARRARRCGLAAKGGGPQARDAAGKAMDTTAEIQDQAKDASRHAAQAAQDTAQHAKDQSEEIVQQAYDEADSMSTRIKDVGETGVQSASLKVGEVKHKADDIASSAKDTVQRAEDQSQATLHQAIDGAGNKVSAAKEATYHPGETALSKAKDADGRAVNAAALTQDYKLAAAQDTTRAAQDAGRQAQDQSETIQNARDAAGNMFASSKDSVEKAADTASQKAGEVEENVTAAQAVPEPATRAEDTAQRNMDQTEDVLRRARDAAADGVSTAKDAVAHALKSAQSEAAAADEKAKGSASASRA